MAKEVRQAKTATRGRRCPGPPPPKPQPAPVPPGPARSAPSPRARPRRASVARVKGRPAEGRGRGAPRACALPQDWTVLGVLGARRESQGGESTRGSFEGASPSFPSLLPPARAIAAGLGMDHWASSSRAHGEGAGRKTDGGDRSAPSPSCRHLKHLPSLQVEDQPG